MRSLLPRACGSQRSGTGAVIGEIVVAITVDNATALRAIAGRVAGYRRLREPKLGIAAVGFYARPVACNLGCDNGNICGAAPCLHRRDTYIAIIGNYTVADSDSESTSAGFAKCVYAIVCTIETIAG